MIKKLFILLSNIHKTQSHKDIGIQVYRLKKFEVNICKSLNFKTIQ
jgi:hypothetical protein